MKKHRRRNNRRKKSRISHLALIIFIILAIILIGDVIGAIIYLRQSSQIQETLVEYMATGHSMSFFQIFWQQFLYQLTIWTMGLSIIGIFINLFLVFVRGISAGFNLAILLQHDISTGILILWLIHYLLILFTTILGVYFSIRFAYLVVISLVKKKHKLLKKYFKLYIVQFIVVVFFITLSSMLSAVVTPSIQDYLTENTPVRVDE